MKTHPHAHPGSSEEGSTPTHGELGGQEVRAAGSPTLRSGQRLWADVFWGDHHSSLPSTDSVSAFERLERGHVSLRGVVAFFLRDEQHECLWSGLPFSPEVRALADPDPLLADVAHRRGARQHPRVGVAAPSLSAPDAGTALC